jgi:hypothetical protein
VCGLGGTQEDFVWLADTYLTSLAYAVYAIGPPARPLVERALKLEEIRWADRREDKTIEERPDLVEILSSIRTAWNEDRRVARLGYVSSGANSHRPSGR